MRKRSRTTEEDSRKVAENRNRGFKTSEQPILVMEDYPHPSPSDTYDGSVNLAGISRYGKLVHPRTEVSEVACSELCEKLWQKNFGKRNG